MHNPTCTFATLRYAHVVYQLIRKYMIILMSVNSHRMSYIYWHVSSVDHVSHCVVPGTLTLKVLRRLDGALGKYRTRICPV